MTVAVVAFGMYFFLLLLPGRPFQVAVPTAVGMVLIVLDVLLFVVATLGVAWYGRSTSIRSLIERR